MVINPQQIINIGTSFVYSWIPALLILWFLIARKTGSRLLPPLVGFLAGAGLSVLAGYGNSFASVKMFPGYENPAFFFSVGVVEESIKFLASFLSLFIISRKNWRQDFHANWLAQAISGSLGFAAAENFVYGIDGQGGIARVIPLIAHTFFAIFWGIGFYKFSLEKKSPKKFWWLLLGLAEGIALHGIYDCVVSESIIPDFAKALSWIVLGLSIFGIIALHLKVIKKLKLEYYGADASIERFLQIDKNQKQEEKTHWFWSLLSVFVPGSGHLFAKKEIFTGLSFLALSLIGPYLFVRLCLNHLASKANTSGTNEEVIFKEIILIAFVSLIFYLAIGLWSAWELFQSNKDIDSNDRKRRLTALFPVSTLFFVSLMMSFFLPAFEKIKANSKGKDEKVVIKEIPLGITWEVEKIPTTPKNQQQNPTLSERSDSIAIDSKSDTQNNLKKEEKSDPKVDKPPAGVPNSNNTKRDKPPEKLPKIGYIGVQLSEIQFQGQTKAYIAFVYPNTSAERAGLRAGDFIISINGKSANGLNAFQVSHLIRGQLGSSVELVVYREGDGEKKLKAYRTGNIFSDNNLLDPLNQKNQPSDDLE